MSDLAIGLTSAIWLGILTSISPCPLATNIAAISYLSKNIVHPNAVLRSGLAYTFGRMVAYALLGFIIVKSLLSVMVIAQFLQQYFNFSTGKFPAACRERNCWFCLLIPRCLRRGSLLSF